MAGNAKKIYKDGQSFPELLLRIAMLNQDKAFSAMLCFVLPALLASTPALSQNLTIHGYIRDGDTGESLIGATVINTRTAAGTTSNQFGFFSLSLKQDPVGLVFSYVGYEPKLISFLAEKDTALSVGLQARLLDEVVITPGTGIRQETMSSVALPVQQIRGLPALLGEVDVLKVLQLLPGVQSGNEGSSGIYIRGGGPDQNLILLDGVPVYNVSHLFGFFSVFNADAINHVELVKGGFPARYGGRLSSVLSISMKDGDFKKVKGEGSIGLISSKFSLEGPIVKDKASFIVSARRTYLDLLARPIIKAATDGGVILGYYFYDLNTKLNYRINNRHRLFLSTYSGDDKGYTRSRYTNTYNNATSEYRDEAGLNWGNVITALRWNYTVTPRLFSNATVSFSNYRFNVFSLSEEIETRLGTPATVDKSEIRYLSGIRDWAAKVDFDFLPQHRHYIRFGAGAILHRFKPGVFRYRSTVDQDTTIGAFDTNAQEYSAYAEDDYQIAEKLKINAGVHVSAFSVESKLYTSIQPRLAMRWLLAENWTARGSYASMTQFIHLLTNAGIGLPTDLWVPATRRIPPQRSRQVALALTRRVQTRYEMSLEGYYKTMENVIEYRDGASYVNLDSDWQEKVVNGDGGGYGTELLIRKNTGPLTGWIGYTLSWADRQFDYLNSGRRFPYRYDRRHDISIALTHQWNDRMDLSLAWVFGTGNAISLPTETYMGMDFGMAIGSSVNFYDGRNNFRMASYHRLDLSLSFKKETRWGERRWTVGAYNAYNRMNPFFLAIDTDKNGDRKVMQYSLFPIIPGISYDLNF